MGCGLPARTFAARPATAPRARAAPPPAGSRSPTLPPDERSSTNPIPRPRTSPSECPPRRRPPQGARSRHGASPPKPLLHEHLNRAYTVAPSDLLSLGARPRIELHRQLVDAMPRPQQARRDLRLDVEAVCIQVKRPRHVDAHDFVAGLHIGNRRSE